MKCPLSWLVVKHFAVCGVRYFTLKDVGRAFPDYNQSYLARLVYKMVEFGMVQRISRNAYLIVPQDVRSSTYIPNSFQLAACLARGKAHYMAYASAMEAHCLAKTILPVVYVHTLAQVRPSVQVVKGCRIRFIQQSETRFFGMEPIWITPHDHVQVSNCEKTIVDLGTRPELGGGLTEISKFLTRMEKRIDPDKLLYYLARNMSMSAKRRILYLHKALHLHWSERHEKMMKELGSGLSLLDPSAPSQGKLDHQFRLRINASLISE